MKVYEIFAVVRGGNPLYRRSWSVDSVEWVSDLRFGGRLYTMTPAGPVWATDLDEARLTVLERAGVRSVHSRFADAQASAKRLNIGEGLPLGQEVAWN